MEQKNSVDPENRHSAGAVRIAPSLRAAMILQFAAGGAVLPFITLYLRDRGLNMSQVSIILATASAMLLVTPFLWGMLADRFIPLNRVFLILNCAGAGLLALLPFQNGFLPLLAAYTLYYGFFNPCISLLHALCFHHLPRPAQQFGRLRAWGSWGWIIPFLPISLWIGLRPTGKLEVIVWLGVALCISMALLSFFLPHTPPGGFPSHRSAGHSDPHHHYGPALRKLLTNPDYLTLLLAQCLVAGSYAILMYYSPPHMEDLGVPRVWIGPAQALGVLFEIVLFPWQATMIRKWNYRWVLLAGCLMLIARHVLFAEVRNGWVLAASYLLSGAVVVLFYMGVSVLVNAIAGPAVRSTAQTLLVLASQGLGPLLANASAGALSHWLGFNLPETFWFAAGLALVASILIAARGARLNRATLPAPNYETLPD